MTALQGFSQLGDSLLTNDLRDNLVAFFDWGLINKGGYENVTLGESGVYGGDLSRLRFADDPNYTNGQVWETAKSNWVWESGVTYSPGPLVGTDNSNPGVSGVYVDSTFYPVSTTGTYSHTLDHIHGRVIFDSAISTSATVQCVYSYKVVNVEPAHGLTFFKRIQKQSKRVDDDEFLTQDGNWNLSPANRVQLPAIGIEVIPKREFKGYQLGGGKYAYTDVFFHCVSEDPYMRDALMDIVSLQEEKELTMFNMNSIADSGTFPIDTNGVPASGALMYEELVGSYPGRPLRLINMGVDAIYEIGDIYVGTVKCTTEVILGV